MTESQPSPSSNSDQDTPARGPRLTRLVLHGYKSFANQTEFIFTSGITAIVGPNGSGKSNIADALRWVLGEQSFTALRGKRTEDMIFSGSEQRPRMGMASVTVTFDNSDGWLPIDFASVELNRRAYRSGENEYHLNGTRVRLRDIQDLLATSGLARRSYAVIGQGLVDQALSLRPEERRVLVEEAAGITAYQRKRDQALSRLQEVQANLVRARDILAEITPRLKRLERQAERAHQHALLQENLKTLLTTWYGYQWHVSIQQLEQAEASRAAQEARLQERRRQVQALEERLQALRAEQDQRRVEIEQGHRQIAALHKELEALTREEAVMSERRRSLVEQREALLSELPPLQAHLHALTQRLQEARARQRGVEEEERTLAADLAQAREALHAILERKQTAEGEVQATRERLLRLTTQLAQLREHHHQVKERLATLEKEQAALDGRLAQITARRQQVQAQLKAHQEQVEALRGARSRLAADVEAQEQAVEEARKALESAQDATRRAHYTLQRLRERYSLLQRLREEGSGLQAGARAVLQAAHQGRLTGVVGVVAELIRVPPHLERAVEEALGGSLQDIVVERWRDAEAAIAFLKEKRLGRATFLPLDTLRLPSRMPIPKGAGILGLAADLVSADARIKSVVELLLNRTVVVQDLATARWVLGQTKGMRIVTVAGELVRGTGRVSGGMGKSREGGMLAREREWRQLPGQIDAATRAVQEAEATVRERSGILARARAHLKHLRQEHQGVEERLARAEEDMHALQAALAQVEGEMHIQQELHTRLESEMRRLQEQRQTLARAEENALAEKEETARALEEAQAEAKAVDDRDARERLAHLEALRATVEGRRQSLEQAVQTLSADVEHQRALVQARKERAAACREQAAALEGQLAVLSKRVREVQERLETLRKPVQQAEERREAVRKEIVRLEQQLEGERRRLHQEESHLGQMTLAVQRARDTLARLRDQIEEDFGLVILEEQTDALPAQMPLPLGNDVATLPRVTHIPPGLEEEVRRLRIQIRNLGHINPDAPQEYEQLQQRHDFLQEQIRDLTEASADLKQALVELDRVMQEEFERTFQAVAREFKTYFRRLFGGGTARLVLTNPEDLNSTGIDIVVRPPGKRAQSLAVLSGGERALTAAALIFAILRVSPTPFCVLDEVDAALDEANIGRFRDALRELATDIQFIIITHNRGTIEVADTIYGISMGRDGVSQALSLRLEEARKHAA